MRFVARVVGRIVGGKPGNGVAQEGRSVALYVLGLALFGGFMLSALYALPWAGSDTGNSVGVAVLTAVASTAMGGIVGFIFGIPRSLQSDASDPSTYAANTNLEQISDWLTKMLVGVGLTQLNELPKSLWNLSIALGEAIGGDASAPAAAGTIIVAHSVLGFLFTYLWTRLYMAELLHQADVRSLAAKVSALERRGSAGAAALEMVETQLEGGTDAPEVPYEELRTAIAGASADVQALIFNRARSFRREHWRSRPELVDRTIPVFKALVEHGSGRIEHRLYGQYGYALKDGTEPDWDSARAALSKAIELRGDEDTWLLYEFNRAVCALRLASRASSDRARDGLIKEARRDLLSASRAPEVRTILAADEGLRDELAEAGIDDSSLRSAASSPVK